MNAMRIRTWLTPIWISIALDALLAGERHEPVDAPTHEDDARHDEAEQDPQDRAGAHLAQGQGRDDEDQPRAHAAHRDEVEEQVLERARGRDRRRGPGRRLPRRPRRGPGRVAGSHGSASPRRRRRPRRTPQGRVLVRQPGDAQADRGLAQQVGQRPGRDDAAVVDDRDPVAQPLDLAQEVRVEEHGGAARAASRMIARTSSRPTGSSADVGSSRITSAGSPRRAVASRGAAACPSRTRRPCRCPVREPDEREDALDLGGGVVLRGPASSAWSAEDLAGGEPRLVRNSSGR